MIISAGLEPCIPSSPLLKKLFSVETYGNPVENVFLRNSIFETINRDEVFVIPSIFCGLIVIELARLTLIVPLIFKLVIEKIPPMDPSMCSQIFL